MSAPTGEVGKITLTPNQQQQLDVVSNLFQLLLGNNNIVNLANLMALQDDQCSDLIITLSAQLDKEFQRLRLASPKGEVAEVGFLSEAQYRKIQKSDVRIHMCEQIARFLLQFVVLVAALTASVSIMDGLPDIQAREELLEPEALRDLPKSPQGDLNPRILSDLVDKQFLKEVRVSGFPAKEVFEFYEDSFIHYKGFLYKRGSSSKIFHIQIDYFRSNTCPQGMSTGQATATSYTSPATSWLTPEEEQEERIRQAKRQAIAEKTQQFEEEKYRAQRAIEEKTKAQEQLEIERYRLRGTQLLSEAKKKYEEMGVLINDIETLFRNEKVKNVSATITPSRPLPPTASDDQKKVYTATLNYNTQLQVYQTYERQIKTLEAEIANEYIDRSATLKNAYEALLNTHRNNVANFKMQQELGSIQTTLSRLVGPAQEGGANEYFVFTISPISESAYVGAPTTNYGSTRYPTSNIGSRSSPAYPASAAFPSSAASATSSAYPRSYGFPGSETSSASMYPSSMSAGPRSNIATVASNNYMSGGAGVQQFVMDYAGNTYDLDYFCRMRGRVSKEQRSTTIRERLQSIFRDESSMEGSIINKVEKDSAKERLSDAGFVGFDFKKESIEMLIDTFGRTISKSSYEIQSPAAQRAYLLMTQFKETAMGAGKTERSVGVKVCDDPWKTANFSDVPAYALLGSLYTNVLKMQDTEANINTTNLKGLPRMSETSADKLWGKAFHYDELYDNSDIREFCSRGISMTNGAAVGIVKTAYNELKRLYSQQLEKVIEYMKQIFVVDRPFITALSAPSGGLTGDSILRLHPRFIQNNAPVELLRIMQQARKDLDAHYSQVEKTYVKAVEDLQKLQKTPTGGGGHSRRPTRKQVRRANRQSSFRRKRVARR